MKKVKLILSAILAAVMLIVTSTAAADFETDTNVVSNSESEVNVVAVNNDDSNDNEGLTTLTAVIYENLGFPIHLEFLDLVYICRDSDTLKSVANTLYGDEKYYLYLAKYNDIDCRDNLTDGQTLMYRYKPDEDIQRTAMWAENNRNIKEAEEERKRIEEENRRRREEEERKRQEEERRKAEEASKGKSLGQFKLTFYTPDPAENGGYGVTATGKSLSENVWKAIAVDPRVIPLGSTVYIEGFGTFTAEDTGGAIKGNRIDVLVNYGEANALGIQYANVYIK